MPSIPNAIAQRTLYKEAKIGTLPTQTSPAPCRLSQKSYAPLSLDKVFSRAQASKGHKKTAT